MEYPINRRQFFYTTAVFLTKLLLLPSISIGKESVNINETQRKATPFWREVIRYPLPQIAEPYTIDEVIEGLKSGAPVGEGDYVTAFMTLIQDTRVRLTGCTVQEQMYKSFGLSNPIDIVFIEGMENFHIDGLFKHKPEPERNLVYINANLKPANFLEILNHELVHGSFGKGEVRAYAHTHRDIAFIISQHPELLFEDDSVCPFYDIMDRYLGNLKIDTKNRQAYFKPGLMRHYYQTFLYSIPTLHIEQGGDLIYFKLNAEKVKLSKDFDLDKRISLLTQLLVEGGLQLDASAAELFLKFSQEFPLIDFFNTLSANFVKLTDDYISERLEHREDKMKLLKAKLDKLSQKKRIEII